MKARIDSKAKTIAIEESVPMDELLKFVKFIAPDDWKTWKVETNVKFEFTSTPIVIHDYSRPWTQPYWYGTAYGTPIPCGSRTTLAANGVGLDSTTAATNMGTSSAIISQARQDGPTWNMEYPVAYLDVKGI